MIFLSLGLLLLAARLLGELARRCKQPALLGELLAGVLLGPTVLGHLAPGAAAALFPASGAQAEAFAGITALAVVLFLLVVGMEISLGAVLRQGRAALAVSAGGILAPFAIGYAVATAAPRLLGMSAGADATIFALFFATAMAISALPVIAKTLMDLGLLRSDFGLVVISAAICNDLVGWTIFAVVMGMIGAGAHHGGGLPVSATVALTLLIFASALTAGRWLMHRILPWIQAHLQWPGGVLGFILALALLGAALMEAIGLHAILGAFLVGVMTGDSHHLRARTRLVIEQFVAAFFAPLLFAAIGLRVDFYANFDPVAVAAVLAIACTGKVLGCAAGARLAGMAPRVSWAVGFAMNSRGMMEIVLGTLALQAGIINERTFVALVVMALVTSALAGPLIQRALRRRRALRFADHLAGRNFVLELAASDRDGAIRELCRLVAGNAGLDAELVAAAVLARERAMSTAVGNHLAVPHARLAGLAAPVVAVGLSRPGLAFDAPDGEATHIVVLVLTASADDGEQLELLADVARTFATIPARAQAEAVRSYTEFLALVRTLHGIEPDAGRARADDAAGPAATGPAP